MPSEALITAVSTPTSTTKTTATRRAIKSFTKVRDRSENLSPVPASTRLSENLSPAPPSTRLLLRTDSLTEKLAPSTPDLQFDMPLSIPLPMMPMPKDEDLLRDVGQMVMVIFDGLTVTPEIRMLIEKYHIGNILLTLRNIRDAAQLSALTQSLQKLSQATGSHYPLMIGIAQENGMLSPFGDGNRSTHFPGSMSLGATRSPQLTFEIAKATALELSAVGINWNFGPVLDVFSSEGNNAISVRAFGDNAQMVGRFGEAFAEGLREGGVGHCAKHFPGVVTTRDGQRSSVFERKTNEEIETEEMVPFKRLVAVAMDSVMLSSSIWPDGEQDTGSSRAKHIIGEVLRRQLGYNGVTICDATDMPIFNRDPTKIGEAVTMAIEAGCDMVQIYHSTRTQEQAIHAIYHAVEKGILKRDHIYRSAQNIRAIKGHYINWRIALAAPDPSRLPDLMQRHLSTAKKTYENSITVVRDDRTLIPLTTKITPNNDVLLLTPVVRPLHPRAPGEKTVDPFESFGRALAHRHPRIIHVPYTKQGITPVHEDYIKRSAAVIFVSCNAGRPSEKSQLMAANTTHQLCHMVGKPMVNIAVCDPGDFLEERKYGTYLCTYEYTSLALETASAVLFGERHCSGVLPISPPGQTSPRQQRSWYVEVWEKRRDLYASADLWQDCLGTKWPLDAQTLSELLDRPGSSKHFVVRHQQSGELLGLACTYSIELGKNKVIGSLALLMVRPTHRDLGIGLSLHNVSERHLRHIPSITSLQLGSIFPRLFPGLPTSLPPHDQSWFLHRGWKLNLDNSSNLIYDLFMPITTFTLPLTSDPHLSTQLAEQGITINNCRLDQFSQLLEFEEIFFGHYPGWVEKYRQLKETGDEADAIVAFKEGGEILGAVLVFSEAGNNQIARDIPWPRVIGNRTGGLGFVGVKPTDPKSATPEIETLGVRKGLIVAALIELKQRGLRGCFIDWADDIETYTSLGFKEWGKYREVWKKI
ncbi:glycoside hydrolase superfamily [Pyronema domesticum]|nr:glycoside hydrolase superfamily [Pyronema domesticum]